MKRIILKQLQQIPGVGNKIAADLYQIGIRSIKDLKGKNPQALYSALCAKKNKSVDLCVLYAFRCAVYYASHKKYNPKLLKWWNWKNK
jgi:hypothetical protein